MKVLARPGFSLIEVTVALSIGAIVMTVAFNVFITAKGTAVEAATRGQMARDAQLVMDRLGKDLSYLGAGVPSGICGDASCTNGSSLRPSVRRALSDNLVFLGDAPFPNADLPGAVTVTRFAGDANSTDIAVSSELSDRCTPHAGATIASTAYRCSTALSSLLVTPTALASPADDCFKDNETRRTCPWALNKWQLNGATPSVMNLVVVAPSGDFSVRKWAGTYAVVNNYDGIRLTAATAGPAILTRNVFFTAVGGAAFVSLDRIFWALEDAGGGACSGDDCVLKRRQCWGEIENPDATDFPDENDTFFGTAETISNCSAPQDGTPWVTIADHIESFTFRYFQGTTELTAPLIVGDLPNVRAVDVELVIKVDVPGDGPVLRHRVSQRFFLPNRDRTQP